MGEFICAYELDSSAYDVYVLVYVLWGAVMFGDDASNFTIDLELGI